MATYYTPIPSVPNQLADADVFNSVFATLDAQIVANTAALGLIGSVNAQLKEWTAGEDYEILAATYDADNVVTTATVKWPDANTGTFTTVSKNATWLAIDAYTITHTVWGKTVTQAAVTRDSNGNVTVKPALTVA